MKQHKDVFQKALPVLVLCLAVFMSGEALRGDVSIDGSYLIDGNSVTKDVFEKYLSTLKEVPGTWFCAETNKGGRTGWDARDDKGVVYEYRCYSESNNSKQTIRQKGKKDNLPPSSSE